VVHVSDNDASYPAQPKAEEEGDDLPDLDGLDFLVQFLVEPGAARRAGFLMIVDEFIMLCGIHVVDVVSSVGVVGTPSHGALARLSTVLGLASGSMTTHGLPLALFDLVL